MGLGEFTNQGDLTVAEQHFRTYPTHEEEEKFEKMVEELQSRFPEEIRVDFIEISPKMTRTDGYAYFRDRDGVSCQYIRIAEKALDYPDYYQKMIVAHEMVHIYCNQKGYGDVSDGDRFFEWILGRVCADINGTSYRTEEWNDLINPFLDIQTEYDL